MSKIKLICPECQEKKVLIKFVYRDLHGKFQNVDMCKQCYDDLKYLKSQTGMKIPRILYRRTKIA